MSCLMLTAVYSLLSLDRCELTCSAPFQIPHLMAATAGPSGLLITQQMRLQPCTFRDWRWQLRLSFFPVCHVLLDCKFFGKVSCTYSMFLQPGTKQSLTQSEQTASSSATAWLFCLKLQRVGGSLRAVFLPLFLFSWGFSFCSFCLESFCSVSSTHVPSGKRKVFLFHCNEISWK